MLNWKIKWFNYSHGGFDCYVITHINLLYKNCYHTDIFRTNIYLAKTTVIISLRVLRDCVTTQNNFCNYMQQKREKMYRCTYLVTYFFLCCDHFICIKRNNKIVQILISLRTKHSTIINSSFKIMTNNVCCIEK